MHSSRGGTLSHDGLMLVSSGRPRAGPVEGCVFAAVAVISSMSSQPGSAGLVTGATGLG